MANEDVNTVQRATATAVVDASIDECYAVVLDIENYTGWIKGITAASVETRDGEGRPERVCFEVEGLGRRATYTLGYDLSAAPEVVAWTLIAGDLTKAIEGRYVFSEGVDESGAAGDDPVGPRTRVDYELAIDLAVPLPGFVKRRAEEKIVDAALRRFKERVESGQSE